MQAHELKDYQRLRAEGRWTQASEFREAERQRFRKAGRSKPQARDESWSAMLVKFPPQTQTGPAHRAAVQPEVDPEVAQAIEEQLDELASRGASRDIQRDLDWAYANMALKNLMPLDSGAPSVSAFDMYRFARDPKTHGKFLEKYLAFTQAKEKADGNSSQEWEDDKRKQFSVLKKLASIVVANIESSLRDAVRLSPDEVCRVLRSMGWTVEMKR